MAPIPAGSPIVIASGAMSPVMWGSKGQFAGPDEIRGRRSS
jgi:hypothetical protein